MRNKSSLLTGAALGVLLAVSMNAAADAKTKKHVKPAPQADAAASRVNALADEIDSLKARLDEETLARQQTEAKAQSAEAAAAAAQADAQAARSQLAEQIQVIPGEVKSAIAAEKPKTDKLYYKGVTVTLGGFLEAAAIYRSHDATADIATSFAKIPFANDRAGRTNETNFSARQSRVSALVQGNINPSTVASFYGELDFQGAAQTANSNESNSYNPRIRHMYGTVDWNDSGWHLLAGQNWSLATMNTKGITPRNELTPPQIDAQYVPGFVWARQPGVRITKNFGDQLWVAVAAENPQTTLSLNGTNSGVATGVTITDQQAPTTGYYSSTNYSLNHVPDFIGKIALEEPLNGHNLHLEVFGIARDFYDRVTVAPTAGTQALAYGYAAGTHSIDTQGGGVGGGAVFKAVPNLLELQASVLSGVGIGRYGSSQLPDATARPDGTLQGIPETMWLAGATFHPTPAIDVYVFGGQEAENGKTYKHIVGSTVYDYGYGTLPGSSNSGCVVEGGSCSALTRSVDQITVGFWDRAYQGSFGKVQFGVQYSHTERKAFADANGLAPLATEDMVFTSFRYYPF